MAVLKISSNRMLTVVCRLIWPNSWEWFEDPAGTWVGYDLYGKAGEYWNIICARWPLGAFPAKRWPTKVRLYVNVSNAGGAAHLLDIHPYNGDGQAEPEGEDPHVEYDRCAAGTEYVDDSVEFRTVGEKCFDLGPDAVDHVKATKEAVDRFTLGFHEEGDNDPRAGTWGADATILEITYPSGGLPANKALIPMGLM